MFAQVINISFPNILNRYKKIYLFDFDNLSDEIALEIHLDEQELEHMNQILDYLNIKTYKTKSNSENKRILLVSSFNNLKVLLEKLTLFNIGFKKFQDTLENFQKIRTRQYLVNNKILDFYEPLIMGILNVTPDSFYDGGKYSIIDNALKHAIEMIELGVDIIDVGGESSRPGAVQISVEEEIQRVIPIIKLIREYSKDIFLSIDTTKPAVAQEALKYGVDIVNDISGYNYSRRMINVIKEFDVPYILMHMKGTPKNMQDNPSYEDVVSEIYGYFYGKIKELNSLDFDKIIIDPGIGFGKRVSDNYEIIQRLSEFKGLGKPIAVGVSNKSLIGKALELDIDKRTNATTSLETVCLSNGANIIRTHNIRNAIEQKKIFKFISNPNELINV